MTRPHLLPIAEQRPATKRLIWLTLHAPELARSVRPGQYLLVRCSAPGSHDPLLRRPLFVAAAEEAIGQIGLLYAPDDRGLAWLARGGPGDEVDVIGPFGEPLALDRGTRTVLLVGQGPGLAALLLLARQTVRRGGSVALLAGAHDTELLPPPFLLPNEIEYQSILGDVTNLLQPPPPSLPARKKKQAAPQPGPALANTLINWADQVCAALPVADAPALAAAVAQAKLRWERGFAQVLLDGPLVCGVGACGVCGLDTRRGHRLLCSNGPTFDLRDVTLG